MSKSIRKFHEQPHLGLLLLTSFAVFNLGNIVDQTIRWTDHLQGFINGIYHVLLIGIVWAICLLPWSLIVFGLYRWRKWRRFCTYWVLAPAFMTLLMFVGGLVMYPATPHNRFKRFLKTELPADIRNLRFHFTGGGITDYTDTYYFETSPAEVDRLILAMALKEDKSFVRGGIFYTPSSARLGPAEFYLGSDVKQFSRDDGEWFYFLTTDSSRTKVHIVVGCY